MNALSMVENFNILKNSLVSRLACLKLIQVHEFPLKDIVKGFNTRIVVTIAFTTHAANHVVVLKPFLIRMRCILASPIGVM